MLSAPQPAPVDLPAKLTSIIAKTLRVFLSQDGLSLARTCGIVSPSADADVTTKTKATQLEN